MKKNNSFSLLEIIIALPLVSLLLLSLIQTYISALSLEKSAFKSSQQIKEKVYFRQRLKRMLLSLPKDKVKMELTKKGILFNYDNGINKSPFASNTVQAELFHKGEHLHLEVFKTRDDKRVLLREEEWLKGVDAVEYLWGYRVENELQFNSILQKEPPLALTIRLKFKNASPSYGTHYIFEL